MSLHELQREAVIIGASFTQVLAITPDDVRRLWAAAVEEHGAEWIRRLNKAADHSDSVDVHVSDDRLSLWLGETPLVRLAR